MSAAWIEQEEWDYIRALVQNIKVTNGDIKYWGSNKFAGINIICSAQSEPGSSAYSGMFAVTKKDDTTVTIAEGIIILGLTTLTFSETDLTITADGYVYMDIVWGGAAYTATPANAASLPAQTNTHYYIPLAAVDFTDSKVGTITQIRYGAIEGSGRAF